MVGGKFWTAVLGAATLSCGSALGSKPNVIIFLVDDMGWQDCSLPFDTVRSASNDIYRTTNLEKLASKGVKFTQAYASAVSSPSRVSLMTGIAPASHRVTNWTLHRNQSQDTHSDSLTMPFWNVNGLQPMGSMVENSIEATTIAELLKGRGYATILCGKAHFGAMDTPGAEPKNLGFDVNIAGHAAGGLASYLGEQNFGNNTHAEPQSPFAVPGLEKYWGDNIFITEALTREALNAVDSLRREKKSRPFFLYMSHYAIHVPLDKDSRFYDQHIARGLSDNQARYAALIEGMDKSLGDILSFLDERQIADNTVIIFMSDNGGLSACGRDGGDNYNAPLRGGKGSAYEGGVRIPMVVYHPKIKRTTNIENSIVAIEDIFPSVLDIAGASRIKVRHRVDGVSWLPLISDKSAKASDKSSINRALIWHYPNRWDCSGDGIGTYSAIRSGDYKFIYFYDTQQGELYNLAVDLGEKHNLANDPSYGELRARIAAQLSSYLKARGAQIPFLSSTGELCAYPH